MQKKLIIVLGVSLLAIGLSHSAASAVTVDDYEARSFTSSRDDTIQYRLFVPRSYDPRTKYPLVLFHHGGGGSGDDNRRQFEGPLPREWAEPDNQAKHPCFIVAPQIPRRESGDGDERRPRTEVMRTHIQTIHEILDSLEKEFSIDTSREYVTGLSMGGECTWMSIIERPDRFAAAVPICAGDRFIGMDAAERGKKFAQFQLWIFHGDADDVISVDVSREVVKALRDAGGNPKYTEYPGVDHGSWEKAYRDPELIEWLFAQSHGATPPLSIPASGGASSTVGSVFAQTYSYSNLVDRLSELQYLATPPAVGEKAGAFSSWDRGAEYDAESGAYQNWWANDDGGGFMDREGTMAELEGPGVIWRIWSAKPERSGNLEIYIDGAKEPTLSMPFLDMFNNEKPPFDYPELVRMHAKGQNFYIPISFQKSIRIKGTGDWGRYYQISYTTFPKTTTVPSFTGTFSESDRAALQKVNDQWARRGPQTHVSLNDKVKQVTVRLEPGQEKVLASYDKPAAITSLTMDRPELTWEESLDVLRELTISMTWDNDAKPAVWSPIGDFFGTGAGENLFKSLTMGMTEDKYYSNWYMPFSKAKIVLRNDGDQPRELTFTIHTANVEGDVNDLLRFHCKWHRDDYSGLEKQRFSEDRWPDWPILKTSKSAGRFCGFQLHIWNPLHLWNEELKGKYQRSVPEGDFFAPGTAARELFDDDVSQHYWWGEGDEKFFVDGEKMPSTFGTGSEDYFGYAWGTAEKFESGLQCQTRNHGNVGHIAVVRCQTADNVPFHESFEATIEKYHGNNWPLLYATTARWYQAPATESPYQEVPLKKRAKYYVQPKLLEMTVDDLVNPSFELSGSDTRITDWSEIDGWSGSSGTGTGVERNEFYSPVNGDCYAFHKGGESHAYQETGHTIAAGETYTLRVWARSINERKNDAATVAEARFHHGSTTIASVTQKVNPVTLLGGPEKHNNDDGGNVWIDQGYRHEFAEKHFYQKVSDDPLTDPWQVSSGDENYRHGMAVGPIIVPSGLRALYSCRYRDRDDKWSSIGFSTVDSGGNPDYKWSDRGTVLSHVGDEDPWVIDPHLTYDEDTGRLWMCWGGGTVYVSEMDPTDGMLINHPEDKEFDNHPKNYHTAVAKWSEDREGWEGDEWSSNWMEGGSLYKHNGYWYFFACYGNLSVNYTIRMGRGDSPTGPFYDKHGVDLMKFDSDRNEYGNTLLLGAEGSQENPGHPHVWEENGTFYMGFDYTKNRGDVFGIRQLYWVDGWPVVAYTPIEVTFKADDHPEAIGKKLGISVRNIGDPASTAAFDHVSLTYSVGTN